MFRLRCSVPLRTFSLSIWLEFLTPLHLWWDAVDELKWLLCLSSKAPVLSCEVAATIADQLLSFASRYYKLRESVKKCFTTEGVGHLQIHSHRLAMEDCPIQLNYTASEMDRGARETSNLLYRSRPMICFPQLPLRSLPMRLSFTVHGGLDNFEASSARVQFTTRLWGPFPWIWEMTTF